MRLLLLCAFLLRRQLAHWIVMQLQASNATSFSLSVAIRACLAGSEALVSGAGTHACRLTRSSLKFGKRSSLVRVFFPTDSFSFRRPSAGSRRGGAWVTGRGNLGLASHAADRRASRCWNQLETVASKTVGAFRILPLPVSISYAARGSSAGSQTPPDTRTRLARAVRVGEPFRNACT